MYILITNRDNTFKSDIRKLIDNGIVKTWELIVEDERSRLVYIGDNNQYGDVALRFFSSFYDGVERLKIMPFVKKDAADEEMAKEHFGIVLGRFAEMLNQHFSDIGSYETVL